MDRADYLISRFVSVLGTVKHCGYLLDLEDHLYNLKRAKRGLENLRDDVLEKIGVKKLQQRVRCTHEMKVWLQAVQVLLEEADCLLQNGDREMEKMCSGLSWGPRNIFRSYEMGKQASQMVDAVEELIIEGVYVDEMLPRPLEEMPVTKEAVGIDSIIDEVWSCIQEDGGQIIGLFGTEGVGKTTLLKKLNNKFLGTDHDFDLVIWVSVSKEINYLEKVQDAIGEKLGTWKFADSDEISRRLRSKKFVLLLDDVWERINLSEIGVHLSENENGYKVVFTSRSEKVCGDMEAGRKFKVEALSPEAALDLFCCNVGEDAFNSHPEIPNLARYVAEECQGLPLALLTIGRAMARKKGPREWLRAIEEIQSNLFRFSGIPNLRFSSLRLGYDSLASDTLKKCFLYCTIFPKEYNIRKYELIQLWVGEGFIDNFDEGEHTIESLKYAYLLEEGDHSKDSVKIHDMIRDMALGLTSENNTRILVERRVGSIKEERLDGRNEAVRMLYWGSDIKFLAAALPFHSLQTLLVRLTGLQTIPGTLFGSMPSLEVLDLSNNPELTSLPASIGELPNLRYLNLSNTNIVELPPEMQNLKNLKMLLLDGVSRLEHIPEGVISSLSSLQVFSCLVTLVTQPGVSVPTPLFDDEAMVAELDCLEHINDISLTLFSFPAVQSFRSSAKLQSCLKRLTVIHCLDDYLDISLLDTKMNQLQVLNVYGSSMETIGVDTWMSFPFLESVSVINYSNLRKLSLSPETAKNLKVIRGSERWWNKLEWDDEGTKQVFAQKFQKL